MKSEALFSFCLTSTKALRGGRLPALATVQHAATHAARLANVCVTPCQGIVLILRVVDVGAIVKL